jgi:hypothetical protein
VMDYFAPSPELFPRPHPATISEEELLGQCTMGKGRSSGPGGQHRNKVETKVMLTHRPTGVMAHASERRSAVENKRVAVFRLRLALATRVRCPVPKGDVRSALWMSRVTPEGKIVVNALHRDYPALLAEAMDMIVSAKYEPDSAAARLLCTMSQLVKLVGKHAPALQAWNKAREERGKHALK